MKVNAEYMHFLPDTNNSYGKMFSDDAQVFTPIQKFHLIVLQNDLNKLTL